MRNAIKGCRTGNDQAVNRHVFEAKERLIDRHGYDVLNWTLERWEDEVWYELSNDKGLN